MADSFDLESLVNLEQTFVLFPFFHAMLKNLKYFFLYSFYDSGYKDGFAHGRIHGLIEGRALGREKGFEMWEELGFYEGFALIWESTYKRQSRSDE